METKNYECSDCKQCLEILSIVADEEATQEQLNFFNQHIVNCEKCMDCFEVEKTLKDKIKQRIERREVPQEILSFIQKNCTEVTS